MAWGLSFADPARGYSGQPVSMLFLVWALSLTMPRLCTVPPIRLKPQTEALTTHNSRRVLDLALSKKDTDIGLIILSRGPASSTGNLFLLEIGCYLPREQR